MKRATSALPYARSRATNILLLKDEVGAPKPTTHKLPECHHTFGKAEQRDKENAAIGKSSKAIFKPTFFIY